MRLYFLTLLVISIPSLCYASEANKPLAQPSTRIEADDEAGLIRFFIKGELKAVLDENGLHVRDNVNYGSMITDTGGKSFEEEFGAKAGGNAP